MLILISETKSSAIDWPSVESFSLDESEKPNKQLIISTKSGSVCKVLNPIGECGNDLEFKDILKAWLDDYTAWTITEGKSKTPPPTGMSRQVLPPLFNCGNCGEELEFGNCTNSVCIHSQNIDR